MPRLVEVEEANIGGVAASRYAHVWINPDQVALIEDDMAEGAYVHLSSGEVIAIDERAHRLAARLFKREV